MRNLKNIIIILLVIVGILGAVRYVYAAQNSIPRYGFLGGTTAWATVNTYSNYAGQAHCRIVSSTSPATTINIIGWTWWQCDLLKGNIVHQAFYGEPRGWPPASYAQADISSLNIPANSGITGFRSRGVHDFNHNGATPWTPYNTVTH
jgi:hypothetical protein